LPINRSPSQCPGTARSSFSAGRSLIMTMSRIWPFVDLGLPWGRLVARPVRRQRHNSLRSAPLPRATPASPHRQGMPRGATARSGEVTTTLPASPRRLVGADDWW
jgi:hypothetical protein